MGYLQQNDKTAAYQKGSFPKACQSSQWHFSFISSLSIDLILELNFPKLKASRTQKREVLCLLLELTTYSKTRFMNAKKRFFFFLLFNLTLFRSRISSTQLHHHRYNVLICSHRGLHLQEGVHLDYLQSIPPHTLARISRKVN